MVRLSGLRGQRINAVDIASVENRRVRSMYQKLSRSQHMARVQCFYLNIVNGDFSVELDRLKVGDFPRVQSTMNLSGLVRRLLHSLEPEPPGVITMSMGHEDPGS